MLAWREQIKCRGLSEHPNDFRVPIKSYIGITWVNVNHSSCPVLERSIIKTGGGGA